VANRIAQAASAVVTGGAAVAAWVANTAAVVANRVATAAVAVAMGVVRAATIAWTAVQWALNAALDANPIGLLVIAIAALVAGIILLWKHSETFRTVVLAVWSAVKAAIAGTVNWFMNSALPVIKSVIDAIINYYKFLWNATKAIWNAIVNAVRASINAIRTVAVAVFTAIVNFIRGQINLVRTIITAGITAARIVWTGVLNGIRTATSIIWNAVVSFIRGAVNNIKTFILGVRVIVSYIKNAFTNAKNAAVGQINALVSLVRSLPGRISSALGSLGSLLYNKGQQIIRGFINGIGSMFGAVRDKARSIVSAVTDFLPGSPAKTGPLSGKGYVLLRGRRFMNDFAQGINDGAQKPTAALAGAVNPLARATVPSGSTTKSGASSVASTPVIGGGTRQYDLNVDGKTLASFVVDAITGNPVAVKKANDRGNQLANWAGAGR
jgi:phage-related protein